MIENGERVPDAKKINEIASGLGIPAMRLRIEEFSQLLEGDNIPDEKRVFANMIKDLLKVAFPEEVRDNTTSAI